MIRACAYTLVVLALCARAAQQPVQNDATDGDAHFPVLAGTREPPGNGSLRAAPRHCGRRRTDATIDGEAQENQENQVCCRPLRSSRVVSDGQCSSRAPVRERVCSGPCLPRPGVAAGAQGVWRCVAGTTRSRRVRLHCPDGGSRTYHITVVTGCRCKRRGRRHSLAPAHG